MSKKPISVSPGRARSIWLRAQKLDEENPFGSGPDATRAAVEHLGYVQIDTINVIERSHHHILFTRIPGYSTADLDQAQSADKSVFEYWTHALSYVPTRDFRYSLLSMKQQKNVPDKTAPASWFASVSHKDYLAIIRRIRNEGPLSIRDIDDDELVEKDHPWASRKPSKRALQLAFYTGDLVVSRRLGMLKTYELTDRHFGWERPKPATEGQYAAYLLERALRAQGIVSLDSICYGDLKWKKRVAALLGTAVRKKELLPVHIESAGAVAHWVAAEVLETAEENHAPRLVHILSPFDPLVIQRKRLAMLFGHDHRFEAYVPADKRVLGYFALPVLVGDRIVAAIDLKADRKAGKLLIQKWTWLNGADPAEYKSLIDSALTRFEAFQLASLNSPSSD
ncbi:YcaQ family DNA glycosylase [Rhizobium sp. TH2]|uniref:winged helix-turn-helix domain-containing protein n=1 Tax=Rhizobium sp. TH2 TaxID=2775403 RepID=UPI002158077A|nr:winged helix DNA-binding domain-containing protein [Rhizobium sp. TH2]UVC06548.1 YcaQ family DNA glycosylase [Rhizobium sp. TH2]